MDPRQLSDSMSSPPRKKTRRDKSAQVVVPSIRNAPSASSTSASRVRSDEAWIQRNAPMLSKKLALFLKQATVINVPCTLEELKKPQDEKRLERICVEELGPNRSAQCISARFVDPNGQTILAYFGNRIRKSENAEGSTIDLSQQYTGRTKETLEFLKKNNPKSIINDGLSNNQCKAYQLASQAVCSALPLHSRFDSTRHEGVNIMKFESGSRKDNSDDQQPPEPDNEEVNPEAYEPDEELGHFERKEQAGVVHLVHGWQQQAQARTKGLFISGDISHTSTSLAAAGSYYYLTQSIAATLAKMFQAVFPEEYRKYEKAFEAGVWMQCDPGPYLGRAIIYKLQGRLHKDKHDLGPSASFGVGYYTGGEMLFPQFGTKFSYDPGHVCIFYSSIIYHKVAKFESAIQTTLQAEEKITPGRIESYQILHDKPPRWGYRTAFGRAEDMDDDGAEYESEEEM
ncbi:hypothetical protein CPB84DRAFT_1810481, partial [Gymnopilus junonius]